MFLNDINDALRDVKNDLLELNMSTWTHESGMANSRWNYATEIFDDVEGRLAKKVYSISSKVLKKNGSIEMHGEMKKIGPFVIKMDHQVKQNSRTGFAGATREHVQIVFGKDGSNDKAEKLFGATAAGYTITKWIMREFNDRR